MSVLFLDIWASPLSHAPITNRWDVDPVTPECFCHLRAIFVKQRNSGPTFEQRATVELQTKGFKSLCRERPQLTHSAVLFLTSMLQTMARRNRFKEVVFSLFLKIAPHPPQHVPFINLWSFRLWSGNRRISSIIICHFFQFNSLDVTFQTEIITPSEGGTNICHSEKHNDISTSQPLHKC